MKAIGMILAGGNNHRMKELSEDRAICAMPVGGSCRSIDFTLSSMSNSHIQKVAVLTQYNARSLSEHLNSSKWWDFGRKQGGVFVYTPAAAANNSNWYKGTADAIYQNLSFLKDNHEPYVIISSGDCVYKLDFNKLLEYHIDKKADITVVCRDMEPGANVERFGTVSMNTENRIEEFEEKPLQAKTNTISCGIYVIRRRLLIELIERCAREERYDFVRDILIRYKGAKRIYGYLIRDYWRNIASVEDYYGANMDFLKPEVRNYFFRQYPNVYSKVEDLPPAKYNVGADVKNSLISGGCIVNGKVEHSILFQNCYIGNNCVIKNSIILNDVYIGDNACIADCIVESRSTIRADSRFTGEGSIRVLVERGERYWL
ncbi:MAG: glucose-1-phosphate adenylyltransferase subunit GlgD [Candidatus Gastranaerophilales bacterium]|nr:glucose-1-phosphate adenylyltransferase subunit GlgD [Candidatus Gastranaerophilales bacterium]